MARTPSSGVPKEDRPDCADDSDLLRRLREELAPGLEVIRHVGEESFGSLFLAREPALRRSVVVKVLARRYARALDARRRFERAGLAAAHISHSNVVPIFRVGNLADGTPFYVEPYLGECTLGERLAALRRFPPAQVRAILHDLAGALAAAHRMGIVHRGLHPGAVRCEEGSDRVMLTDFGLSGLLESVRSDDDRLTPSGEVLGSAGYMSPEQMAGQAASDRSDVYALGLIAWRLLSGSGSNPPAPPAHAGEPWRNWEESVGDADLCDLIRRCLAESAHDRPAAADVEKELEATGGSIDVRSGHETFWSMIRRRRIPHALVIYAGSIWVGLQIVDQLVQQRVLPRFAYLVALITAIAGFPAALVVAWYHGARGRQRVTPAELWVLGVVALGWLVAVIITWIRIGVG